MGTGPLINSPHPPLSMLCLSSIPATLLIFALSEESTDYIFEDFNLIPETGSPPKPRESASFFSFYDKIEGVQKLYSFMAA